MHTAILWAFLWPFFKNPSGLIPRQSNNKGQLIIYDLRRGWQIRDRVIDFWGIPFWAHMCTLHGGLICIAFCLSVCPSVRPWLDKNSWTVIHISKTTAPRVMKFGQKIDMDDPKVDLEGQGHRLKVKVTRSKTVFPGLSRPSCRLSLRSIVTQVKVKSHMGRGQRSTLKLKVKGQGQQVKNEISGLIWPAYW